MAKNKTEIHVTTVFDGELDATDVFVSLRGMFLANLFRFKRLAVQNNEIYHAAGVFRVRWATT